MKNIKLNSQLMIHNIITLNFILIQCNFKEPLEFITVNIFLNYTQKLFKIDEILHDSKQLITDKTINNNE